LSFQGAKYSKKIFSISRPQKTPKRSFFRGLKKPIVGHFRGLKTPKRLLRI
jgi:hypothetical protein